MTKRTGIRMRQIGAAALSLLFAACLAAGVLADAGAEAYASGTDWYVCFSTQSYAVRTANKMSAYGDGSYVLSDVSLSSDTGFYVTDGADVKYYASDGEDMTVDSSDTLRYDIRFNPDSPYDEDEGDGWAVTNCRITYKLYSPGEISVTVTEGEETRDVAMTYNSYLSSYDEYYISSLSLNEGAVVSYDGEEHEVSASGYWRILYTPGKTVSGNYYLYDSDGNYGSGDDYAYHLYLEEALRYFAVFPDTQPDVLPDADTEIGGESAYLLSRYENNTAAAEYRSGEFFLADQDMSLRYEIYEEQTTGAMRLLDDDDDDTTEVEKLRFTDAGWYELSLLPGDSVYVLTAEEVTLKLDGFYLAGNFNDWGYDEEGNVNLSDDYLLTEVDEDDDYYDEDYTQYSVTLTVTAQDLRDGDIEFYITDGETKYRNLTENIVIDEAGTYRILFSDEHIYGNSRRYRYFLEEGDSEETEICLSSAEDWEEFAAACNASADYSVNLSVYLKKDIDFSGSSFTPVVLFRGEFHGGYHSLLNITVDENARVGGVFGTVAEGAVVERLYAENLTIENTGDDYTGFAAKNYGTLRCIGTDGTVEGERYTGGIAGYNGRTLGTGASSDEYENAVIDRCENSCAVSGATSTGGIAGYSTGEIRKCTNAGTVSGASDNGNDTVIAIGGICGYNAGKMTACENTGAVSGGGYSSLYVGGAAGVCTGEMYFVFNRADVSGTRYVGGIAGWYGTISSAEDDSSLLDSLDLSYSDILEMLYDDSSSDVSVDDAAGSVQYLTYLYNEGTVTADSYAGGILGYAGESISVDNCVSVGDVAVTAGSYAGGIIGYTETATVTGALSAGTVSASGTLGGSYVGGICGYGYAVLCSVSVADLDGNDYIGGICGYAAGEIRSSYTVVTIVSSEDSNHIGGIAGYAAAWDEADGDFSDLVAYNYYVGSTGGIAGTDYGAAYDYAAYGLTSAQLASEDTLSAYLSGMFDAEYWAGGDGEATYPVPYYLLNADVADEYGDDAEFESLFESYGADFTAAANGYTRVSAVIVFLEWNPDNGDLYDDDGELDPDVYEVIEYARVYGGDAAAEPDFVYAELQEDGTWICETDEGWYFVTFESYAAEAGGTVYVYAVYTPIAFTLADADGTVLVEGLFDENTEVSLESTSSGIRLVFTLDGEEVAAGTVTVRYYVGEDADRYTVYLFSGGELTEIDSSVSGSYLVFSYTDGQYVVITKADGISMPGWAMLLIGIAAGAALLAVAWGICAGVRRKKAVKAEAAQAPETAPDQACGPAAVSAAVPAKDPEDADGEEKQD